jgi:hypothetical protein
VSFFFWNQLDRIEFRLEQLIQEVHRMAVDQETFDAELAALVSAIGDLNTAVDALLASKASVDLTAEEASVQAAAASVAAELAKITPPA